MARYHGPKCRLCRREGLKLFLKGLKCNTAKCPIEKRSKPPGMHGWHRGRPGDYGIRLREKQKLRRFVLMTERPFERLYQRATKATGKTGEALLRYLECRLDNVVRRLGFSNSIKGARQLVNHGHIRVNGRKVDISSYNVKPGDEIEVKPAASSRQIATRGLEENRLRNVPGWLTLNAEALKATVVRLPVRDEMEPTINEQLIVEYYSRF